MTTKKPSITNRTRSKYHQGSFRPKNPEKYIGNKENIIYRSKWELMFLKWADETPSVLKYSSEECVIPYISPIDGKQHRYFMDFFIRVLQSDGTIKNFLVEVKPFAQTQPPKTTRKKTVMSEAYQDELRTYAINQAKWQAARKVCAARGWEFMIITEKQLFRKHSNDKTKRKAKKSS